MLVKVQTLLQYIKQDVLPPLLFLLILGGLSVTFGGPQFRPLSVVMQKSMLINIRRALKAQEEINKLIVYLLLFALDSVS